MIFKIINRFKFNNNNIKFNGDFKSYITVERTLEERLAFPKRKKKNYLKTRKTRVLEEPIQQIFYVQDYHNINSPQEVLNQLRLRLIKRRSLVRISIPFLCGHV